MSNGLEKYGWITSYLTSAWENHMFNAARQFVAADFFFQGFLFGLQFVSFDAYLFIALVIGVYNTVSVNSSHFSVLMTCIANICPRCETFYLLIGFLYTTMIHKHNFPPSSNKSMRIWFCFGKFAWSYKWCSRFISAVHVRFQLKLWFRMAVHTAHCTLHSQWMLATIHRSIPIELIALKWTY